MGGGFIQLVAYGAQDIYLTGNPQITFFKHVYRRHTNFASENFNQFPIGNINWGNKLVFTISRKGDLLGKCYIDFYLEFYDKNDILMTIDDIKEEYFYKDSSLAKSFGFSLIDYIEIDIGGQIIDTHNGHWLAIKSELSQEFNKRIKEILMNGPFNCSNHLGKNIVHVTVPLQFWFNQDPGLYLPLVALQHHDVKISVKLKSINEFLINNSQISLRDTFVKNIKINDFNLNCDYIYLDTEERRKFAQVCHEYLIEQLQIQPGEFCRSGVTELVIPLNFNHPVKEIVWTLNEKSLKLIYGPLWSNASKKIKTCLLQMNGIDRLTEKPSDYFRIIQKYQHHSGINFRQFIKDLIMPLFYNLENNLSLNMTNNQLQYTALTNVVDIPIANLDIFLYSFALHPEKIQPSGSCNFSRLDNSVLKMTFDMEKHNEGDLDVNLYAVNFNVLRIKAGMGGLAYSN